jgi:hypothetical protein
MKRLGKAKPNLSGQNDWRVLYRLRLIDGVGWVDPGSQAGG